MYSVAALEDHLSGRAVHFVYVRVFHDTFSIYAYTSLYLLLGTFDLIVSVPYCGYSFTFHIFHYSAIQYFEDNRLISAGHKNACFSALGQIIFYIAFSSCI